MTGRKKHWALNEMQEGRGLPCDVCINKQEEGVTEKLTMIPFGESGRGGGCATKAGGPAGRGEEANGDNAGIGEEANLSVLTQRAKANKTRVHQTN